MQIRERGNAAKHHIKREILFATSYIWLPHFLGFSQGLTLVVVLGWKIINISTDRTEKKRKKGAREEEKTEDKKKRYTEEDRSQKTRENMILSLYSTLNTKEEEDSKSAFNFDLQGRRRFRRF